MLHRFLFVAGMTVGVTTPLVWAAYVARPAPQAARPPTVTIAKATPEAEKPSQAAAKHVTASIPPAPATTSSAPLAPKTAQATQPKPKRSLAKLAHVAQRHRAEPRYLPAVVESYNGSHIITVCAALTENEQLRAGCP